MFQVPCLSHPPAYINPPPPAPFPPPPPPIVEESEDVPALTLDIPPPPQETLPLMHVPVIPPVDRPDVPVNRPVSTINVGEIEPTQFVHLSGLG